ncbi:endocytosis defective- protein [Coemansia furcata]|uniref:Endocytosis defective- protein n=1 Tax=Coemansia furcata TaxID=417177 RepID=A0ACC1LM08_9FUNG|nr:endocytosis defective- protein [Coemansia furcata]
MSSLSISSEERQQYQQHFFNANPRDGKLPGPAARENLMQSGLPTNQLGGIWELADIDKDGALDLDEYCIALKLVFSLINHTIPAIPPTLPPELIPQSRYQYFVGNPVGNTFGGTPTAAAAQVTLEWYVPGEDRVRYEGIFAQYSHGSTQVRLLDLDEFLNTLGIPRSTVTQAWGLVDVRKYQQLNSEQFVFLLHILNYVAKGARVPDTLSPAVKDTIYRSLNLDSDAGGSTQGYRYSKPSTSSVGGRPGDSRKPGLYGEKSGNVALADSYLSKLKTSSTFKNEAGSRYASSSKNTEEERKLRNELKELDEELKRIKSEGEQQATGSRDEEQLEKTLAELKELKTFKIGERTQSESTSQSGGESVQEIKQSIFNLEGHLALLLSGKRTMDEFISTSKQDLLELQMEQVELK